MITYSNTDVSRYNSIGSSGSGSGESGSDNISSSSNVSGGGGNEVNLDMVLTNPPWDMRLEVNTVDRLVCCSVVM